MEDFATVEEMMEFVFEVLCKGDIVMFEDGGIFHAKRPKDKALVIEFENSEPVACMTATKQTGFFEVRREVRA